MTVGARLIPAAQTALIGLLEVVLGPLWVWIAYTEQPSTTTLIGGAIVIARDPRADGQSRAPRHPAA